MLRWRLLLGTLIVAALVGLCWLDMRSAVAGIWLLPVAALFVILASQEIIGLLRAGGLQPSAGTVYFGNLLLLAVNWAQALGVARGFQPAEWLLVTLAICVLLAFVHGMWHYAKPGGTVGNIAATCFAVVYVGLMFAFLVQLRLVWGMAALAALLIVVKMSDIGAYTVGRLIGRHKMAPRLSPGKTLEGAGGALAFSLLASWATFGWLVPAMLERPAIAAPGWGWAVFGVLIGTAGMLGDLAESLIKRDVGRKDSSTWLPGYGGVLDMVDSVLMAAPVAWFCWHLGLVGR
jgi:phosphatidate cytidylyltransferase